MKWTKKQKEKRRKGNKCEKVKLIEEMKRNKQIIDWKRNERKERMTEKQRKE